MTYIQFIFTFGSSIGVFFFLFFFKEKFYSIIRISRQVRKLALSTYINWRIVVKIFSYQRTDSTLKKYDIFVYECALIRQEFYKTKHDDKTSADEFEPP